MPNVRFLLLIAAFAVSAPARGGEYDDLAKHFDAERRAGRSSAAETTARRMLAVAEQAKPPRPELVARALTKLAISCADQDKHAEALALHQRALAIRERELPAGRGEIIQSLDNLAAVYDRLGRFREAAAAGERAVELGEKALRAEDLRLAHAQRNLALIYDHQGRLAEAEPLARRALASYEKTRGPEHLDVAGALAVLARLCDRQGGYVEAETLFKRALAIRQKLLPANHVDIALTLGGLAQLYDHLGRYGEAESLFKQALAIYGRAHQQQSFEYALRLNQLGVLYEHQGRYAEAEPLYKEALAVAEQVLPPEHPDRVTAIHNLAALYHKERRYGEAEPLYRRALALWEQTLPPDHPATATCVANLAVLYKQRKDYAAAEKFCQRALAARMKSLGPENPGTAPSLNNLAALYHQQHRDAEAAPLFEKALAIREKALGGDHPDVAASLHSLANFSHDLGRDDEAEALVDRAIAIRDRAQVSPAERFDSYKLRAEIAWSQGNKSEAAADLRRALDLAEQQRGQSSGAEQERAEFFGRFSGAFELMVAWQLELGDLNEALSTIERSRARSLLDEMKLGAVDLEIGRSPLQRERLRRREMELQGQVAARERRLSEFEARDGRPASADETNRLQADLAEARAHLYGFYRDQRSTSPIYRNLLSVGGDPPRLSQIRRRLIGDDGLLLAYLFGENGGYVLAVGPQQARLIELQVSERWAGLLGVEPGPLTAERLRAICAGENGRGVVAQLTSPRRAPQAVQALYALWMLLVPEPQREALVRGSVRKLIVAPDGPLAWLPLETLVVEPSGSPRYLLDLDAPILYAPSATVLYNLAERSGRSGIGETSTPPVLTVADPQYPSSAASGDAAPADEGRLQIAPRSRYRSAGGSLSALPYSGLESARVAEVFEKRGISVAELRKQAATEANVRAGAANRRLVHLACHGLAEQSFGNFFGALALTPGASDEDPADDGFLTLPEIYELNLKGCELAILSACQTNYGPLQQGEGIWALSRGFLVAGARRVAASNWLVDDEAAATLVGAYCRSLAKAAGDRTEPDYARALQEAKRYVRRQEKWQSPYYWGSFVLVGPD